MFDRMKAVVADQHQLVESLASLAPAGLGPVLARLDRTMLAGTDLAAVLAAEQRLVCWACAGMAAGVAEFARCPTDRFADVLERPGFCRDSVSARIG